MLVLSRKEGERIVMPNQEVIVTIVAIHGNRVRIGVTAPAGVAIYREEILPAAVAHDGCAGESPVRRGSCGATKPLQGMARGHRRQRSLCG